MADNKTARNDTDPLEFIAGLDNPQRQEESRELLELFKQRTGDEPIMWGDSIIGFGSCDYRYKSGRAGTWMRVGFSPRKQQMTVYIMPGSTGSKSSWRDWAGIRSANRVSTRNVSTPSTKRSSASSSPPRTRRWGMAELRQ